MNNSRIITVYIMVIVGLLATYFIFSFIFFPNYFLSQSEKSKPKPMPIITYVNTSESKIYKGESFKISLAATNKGDNADVQTVSVSFPNSTSLISRASIDNKSNNNTLATILRQNFTQNPIFIARGDQVGSNYSGGGRTTIATYPLIQFYSRPWESNHTYHSILEIKPPSNFSGKFMMFVKSVALPHTIALSHYPYVGIQDSQHEFVDVYYVDVRRGSEDVINNWRG
jgi:hypothetical protein